MSGIVGRTLRTLLLLFITVLSHAQTSAFEVASLKPNHSGSLRQHYPFLRNGTMTAENISLKVLIGTAYGISGELIYGPKWLDVDRYDVNAKAPNGVPDSDFKPMLQTLLKARFHLASHREQREMDAFDMVVAKSGLKLVKFDPVHEPPLSPRTGGWVLFGSGTMADLAQSLTTAAGKPVVDRTGVPGRYFYDLQYTPLSAPPTDNPAAPPDIFTAVHAQLGLRLEKRKQPIEVLVIDSVRRAPDEN
jgi:uncharacterized protein (TIGR03435 family)